ncbi:probable LRR receptor-like serine/threonine-protein kinase At1g74360 [Rosa rugosa]|uniref:probable LRR receptor-like serine/threonine-protein kinase At1g74360 n=1 Tax=Rosa rugosa TaxID=74645 RepID=UPI002B41489C|nr:probable LRR receptor-like serine/threonine-protein kinase At1g74360 [Rosa rugosa]
MYSNRKTNQWRLVLYSSMLVITMITVDVVAGDSLDTDKEVLLILKAFLQEQNRVNQGEYSIWNQISNDPCEWPRISCNGENRVTAVNLAGSKISGEVFRNFSSLTALSHLDLSMNTLSGAVPEDLSQCLSLKYLNLSFNILESELKLHGLSQLTVLDLAVNRFYGDMKTSFPGICTNLVVLNVSLNNFTGRIDEYFDECLNLQYLDLSSNNFSGDVWVGFTRLREFSVADNNLSGVILPSVFNGNCSLVNLDLSENNFSGRVPKEISNCRNLVTLNLWGNKFTGVIPSEIGGISSLKSLSLGNNTFSRVIPESLLELSSLVLLDLSRNNFGGDIQDIFGKFTQVKFLVLHSNSYRGGIYSSGILKLPNVSQLDLSHNNFAGCLPVEVAQMQSLKYLFLAYNQFNGTIPPEYGNLLHLQALDLSFNSLTGSIPTTIGKLNSLLLLMLARNMLTGPIPKELGNCTSLLWLNLSNNKLNGTIPSELKNIGTNVGPTFESNNQDKDQVVVGSGECLEMKRWIPGDYSPFSFVYTTPSRKSCRNKWDQLLKGNGGFPMCTPGSSIRTSKISGYIQLSGNQLSGQVPPEIGKMHNFSMLDMGFNKLHGELPAEIGQLPLVVLNLSRNSFSGDIPMEMGNMKCMQNLDLSYNNFSGKFPISLNSLTELSKFTVAYNPLISGVIPSSGQLATFEEESYLGDPLLILPTFIKNSPNYEDGGDTLLIHPEFINNSTDHEDEVIGQGFYNGMGIGFAVGFWGVCASLIFIRSWRYSYYRFLNFSYDWLYVRLQKMCLEADD